MYIPCLPPDLSLLSPLYSSFFDVLTSVNLKFADRTKQRNIGKLKNINCILFKVHNSYKL